MAKKLTTEEIGVIFRTFIEIIKFAYNATLSDLQVRLEESIGEELTPTELKVFREEFEYAIANMGFVLLIPKLSEVADDPNQDILFNAYLLTMYASPICGEKVSGINNQHSKDFHTGFIKYHKLGDLKLMIDEICEQTQIADKSNDFIVTSGKSLRTSGLRKLLTEVIFPLTFNTLKDFLDKPLKN